MNSKNISGTSSAVIIDNGNINNLNWLTISGTTVTAQANLFIGDLDVGAELNNKADLNGNVTFDDIIANTSTITTMNATNLNMDNSGTADLRDTTIYPQTQAVRITGNNGFTYALIINNGSGIPSIYFDKDGHITCQDITANNSFINNTTMTGTGTINLSGLIATTGDVACSDVQTDTVSPLNTNDLYVNSPSGAVFLGDSTITVQGSGDYNVGIQTLTPETGFQSRASINALDVITQHSVCLGIQSNDTMIRNVCNALGKNYIDFEEVSLGAAGRIQYDHTTNIMSFYTNDDLTTAKFRIEPTKVFTAVDLQGSGNLDYSTNGSLSTFHDVDIQGTLTFEEDVNAGVGTTATFYNLTVLGTTNIAGEDVADLISTGLISGGLLSIGSPTSKFNITAGTGIHIDPLTRVVTTVSWTAFTNQSITNIEGAAVTYISINSSGAIVQSHTRPDEADYRNNIFLGALNHPDFATITDVEEEASYILSPASQLIDLYEAIGNMKIGCELSGVSSTLNFIKGVGYMVGHGVGYVATVASPNKLTSPSYASSITQFEYIAMDGEFLSYSNVIDPDQYNTTLNTLVAVGANKWTVQHFYQLINLRVVVMYGQTIYNSLNEAEENYLRESFAVDGSVSDNSIFLGYLIVKKGCTDLTDSSEAVFINAGKFGEGATQGLLTGNSSLQTAYDDTVALPHIEIDANGTSLGALQVKAHGSVSNSQEWLNSAGSVKASVSKDGDITGATLNSDGGAVILGSTTTNSLISETTIRSFGDITCDTNVGIGVSADAESALIVDGSSSVGTKTKKGVHMGVTNTGYPYIELVSDLVTELSYIDFSYKNNDRRGRIRYDNNIDTFSFQTNAVDQMTITNNAIDFTDCTLTMNNDLTVGTAFVVDESLELVAIGQQGGIIDSALHIRGLRENTLPHYGVHFGSSVENGSLYDFGMKLVSSTLKYSTIDFTIPNVDYKGQIKYDHTDDTFYISTNGAQTMTLSSTELKTTGKIQGETMHCLNTAGNASIELKASTNVSFIDFTNTTADYLCRILANQNTLTISNQANGALLTLNGTSANFNDTTIANADLNGVKGQMMNYIGERNNYTLAVGGFPFTYGNGLPSELGFGYGMYGNSVLKRFMYQGTGGTTPTTTTKYVFDVIVDSVVVCYAIVDFNGAGASTTKHHYSGKFSSSSSSQVDVDYAITSPAYGYDIEYKINALTNASTDTKHRMTTFLMTTENW